MTSHPTIVHAAADLHRQALLTEAAGDRRTIPPRLSDEDTVIRAERGASRQITRALAGLATCLNGIQACDGSLS